MVETTNGHRLGLSLFTAILVIPLIGCGLAIYFNDMRWLVLLALWIVFMEAAFVMIPVAALIVSWWLGR